MVLVIWVGSIVLSLVGVLAYALIIVVVSATLGNSEVARGFGAVLAQLVQLPFSLLVSLLSVLLVLSLPSTTSAVRWSRFRRPLSCSPAIGGVISSQACSFRAP